MQITRTSRTSGVTRTIDLPITDDQISRYEAGALIQEAFPHLTADQREFYMTGITAEEWDQMFADPNDEPPHTEDLAAGVGGPPDDIADEDNSAFRHNIRTEGVETLGDILQRALNRKAEIDNTPQYDDEEGDPDPLFSNYPGDNPRERGE